MAASGSSGGRLPQLSVSVARSITRQLASGLAPPMISLARRTATADASEAVREWVRGSPTTAATRWRSVFFVGSIPRPAFSNIVSVMGFFTPIVYQIGRQRSNWRR